MDALEIIARLAEGHDKPPTNTELAAAANDLRDALDAATSAEEPDLDLATDLREALNQVVGEQAKREQAAEETRAAMLKLREGVFPTADEADEADEEPAEEPVKAAAPSVRDLTARLRTRAATAKTPEPKAFNRGALVKSAGVAVAYELPPDASYGQLGGLFATHAKSVMTVSGSAVLARLQRFYDVERTLGSNVDTNNTRLANVFGYGQKPVTAAGGLCGPGDVDHTHPVCSEGGRPIRAALPSFQASRGTVTFAPAMSVGDLSSAVSIWTAATDADPGEDVKPCPALACPEEISASVDAVVRCLTVGNFQATFSPEFWAASLETLLIAHDRLGEQKSIREIHAASTAVGSVDEGDTLTSVLTAVNNLVSADRSAHRNLSGGYTLIGDAYARDQVRNQVAKDRGYSVLQAADALIDGWLAEAGVTQTVWTYDGSYTGSAHRTLAPGAVPTVAGFYLFPTGAHLFLDGGTIDLGTSITDSALNATNDRQAFAESFEKTVLRGCSSYAFTVPVESICGCPVAVGG